MRYAFPCAVVLSPQDAKEERKEEWRGLVVWRVEAC